MSSPDTVAPNMPRPPKVPPPSRYVPPARDVVEAGFGTRLRLARLRAGINRQADLARATGIGPVSINRHEMDRTSPSLENIRIYADILGVSASYLQYGLGDPEIPAALNAYLRSERADNLLEETRARLRRVPWSVVVATPSSLTKDQVHTLAVFIDENLRAYACRRDAKNDVPLRRDAVPNDARGAPHADPHSAVPAVDEPRSLRNRRKRPEPR